MVQFLTFRLAARSSRLQFDNYVSACSQMQGAQSGKIMLRVCTHKSCKRQGSRQIVQFVQELALDHIEVTECGCLSNCGSGPNMAVMPTGLRLPHMSTPSRVIEGLSIFCGMEIDAATLRATQLRLAGNAAAREGNFQEAINLYTQGLSLNPGHGSHLLLCNRSGARLSGGDAEGALEDACCALKRAPAGFPTATLRQVEALLQLGRYLEAQKALLPAIEACPGLYGDKYQSLMEAARSAQQQHQEHRISA